MSATAKITPCLWFDNQAEEAAEFYCSIFKNSKITKTTHYTESAKNPPVNQKPGSVMTVEFEIDGQSMMALNGGPVFQFNEAISLIINCDSQAEVDDFWKKMSADPKAEQCGWIKDKFGLSWQIVPKALSELTDNADPASADRVFKKMLQMKKLDIAELKAAA